MKFFKRLAAAAVAGAMILQTAAYQGITAFGAESPKTYGGWYETAYATWFDTAAASATVSYSVSGENSYTTVDSELVRQIDSSTGRVDIPGLAAGDYDIKIVTSSGTTYEASVTVLAEDRSGYAFETRTLATENYDGESVGAYKADGTPKDNAEIIYVTEDNKNTVTYGKYTGIGQILGNARNLSDTPLIIRFIGEITTTTWSLDTSTKTITEVTEDSSGNTITPIYYLRHNFTLYSTGTSTDTSSNKYYDYTFNTDKSITTSSSSDIPSKNEVIVTGTTSSSDTDTFINMCYAKAASGKNQTGFRNITLEGIGTDATISNWGFDFRYGNSVEVKNLNFVDYPEDACSAQYFSRVWIHRCNFYRGHNDCDLTAEQDKGAGDGSSDMNENYNVTLAYNYYYATKKTSLNGGSDSSNQYDYTYHHNYYYNCGSRLPLTRYVNLHSYNNYDYIDNDLYTLQEGHTTTSTAISARASAWVFSEANYYDNGSSKYTNKIFSPESTSYGTGFIKSYNDYINNCTYTSGDYVKIASSRSQTYTNSTSIHTSESTASGGYIDNFDTNSSYFYLDSSGNTDVTYLTSPEEAKAYVSVQSGALKDGVTYTALETDDGYTTIDNNQSLLYSDYDTGSGTYNNSTYFQGTTTITYKDGYMRFTSATTVSFKAAAGATVTVNAKNGSSGTEGTLTFSGKNTASVTETFAVDTTANYKDVVFVSNSSDEDIYTLTATGSMNIKGIYVTFGDSSDETTETTTEAGVIYDKAVLTFTEAETISEATTLCDYFSITPSMTVDKSSKTVYGTTYSYRIKSGGKTTMNSETGPTNRAISFKTADSAVIQICGAQGSSDTSARTISIYKDSSFTTAVATIDFTSSDPVMSEIINLTGGGTYYITFGASINIYSVNVAVGRSVTTDSDGNGYIYTDGSDSYAVVGVTADKAESEEYSKLTVTAVGSDGQALAETDTVYSYATVDGFVIKPDFLDSTYGYLYVVQIEGSGGAADFTYSGSLT